jgi:hypothetical protein
LGNEPSKLLLERLAVVLGGLGADVAAGGVSQRAPSLLKTFSGLSQ